MPPTRHVARPAARSRQERILQHRRELQEERDAVEQPLEEDELQARKLQRAIEIGRNQAARDTKKNRDEAKKWWDEQLRERWLCCVENCKNETPYCWVDFDKTHHKLNEMDIAIWAVAICRHWVHHPMPRLNCTCHNYLVNAPKFDSATLREFIGVDSV